MAILISVDSVLAHDSHKRSGGRECGFIRRQPNGGTGLEDTSEDDGKHLIRS